MGLEYLYSKKVLENFKNPKNMGSMKNPDGVGKVGNPICVIPDTKVQLNPNVKEISALSIKDKVVGHDGIHHNIRRIFKRKYSGKIIKIKNRLGITYVTPEHECLAIKLPKTHHFSYTRNKKKEKPFWYHAQELEKGDILLYPIIKKIVDIDEIKTNVKKLKWDFKSKNIPSKIKIDPDFLKLSGYFLSEGHPREEKCKTYLTFSFDINEKKYVNDVKRIIKKIFNLDSVINISKKRNTINLFVYNAQLTRFFKRLFGHSAETKKLPDFMMFLPLEKQKHIILGLWRGDGFVNKKIPRAGYSTISYKLCQQLKILLIRQRIIPSIYVEDERTDNDGTKHKKAYRIHIGHRKSFLRLMRILNIKFNTKKDYRLDSWSDKNFIYIPIIKISIKFYNGFVNNLEVEEARSFVSESATLHNCGDVMHLYIKVKNNRIKDIKFETFGCVAAISTSSIITQIAKGKTIKDALKISRERIVKEVGGLPPQKIHCSVLVSDALKEAIYDYLNKNKLKIPKELEKEHKEISKRTY
ncbi:MAG: iron-sulfur cluster assembly scaffold protein [Candidatus Aenigmatarchaeota archaeon]